ncbi:MAG TPA: chemotaxis protein CheB [Polyangia bacterium]|jgi:two-component system chemotaxis response regulator CheB|nr:chemotaxis protein CheB [Polyangia bacterium]
MAAPRLIVVGASAGGVEALTRLVHGIQPDIRAPILVVLHISEQSILPAILDRAGPLPAAHVLNGETLQPGRIYVAPPGQHLLVDSSHLWLTRGPRENGHRPAIDPLFRSAARTWRDRVVGVLLSGQMDDGVAGLYAIRARGGITVVQDPKDAIASSMPQNALRLVDVNYCLPAAELGPLLMELVNGGTMATRRKRHTSAAKTVKSGAARVPRMRGFGANKIGERPRASPPPDPEQDPLRCPDCSGPLYQVPGGGPGQWGCREGHVFSPESLSGAQTEALERALWLAVRTMKERALIDRSLGAVPSKPEKLRTRVIERAQSVEHDIELLRQILQRI